MAIVAPLPRPTETPLAAERGEIRALTGLRIVAAMWVVIFHFHFTPGEFYARYWQPVRPIVVSGALGVDLFFVLSGFVITYTYLDKLGVRQGARARLRATLTFLWARIGRIWPTYVLVTTVFGLWLALRLQTGTEAEVTFQPVTPTVDLGHWAVQLLGIQQWLVPSCDGCSFVGPAWSVSAEWLAYACFPLLVLVIWQARRLPGPVLGALAVLAMLPLALIAYRTGSPYFPWSWLLRIGAGFTSGALTYLAVRRIPRTRQVARLANTVAVLAVIEIVVALYAAHTRTSPFESAGFGGVVLVLFPVLIGALALSDRGVSGALSAPLVVHGGRISYSLYLLHIPVFEVFWTAMLHVPSIAPGTRNAAFLAPQVLLGTVLGAHLLFRHVEEPARGWLRRHDPTRCRARGHRVGSRRQGSSGNGIEVPSTLPSASSACTAATGARAGTGIAVSKPVRGASASGRSVVARSPASTRQLATSVAPFQLANTVIPPSDPRRATPVGGSAGRPVHSKRSAR